jgi:hypothetical protein
VLVSTTGAGLGVGAAPGVLGAVVTGGLGVAASTGGLDAAGSTAEGPAVPQETQTVARAARAVVSLPPAPCGVLLDSGVMRVAAPSFERRLLGIARRSMSVARRAAVYPEKDETL